MSAPTVVDIKASQAVGTTTITPTTGVGAVGDLIIVWKGGAVASVGTSVPTSNGPTAFSTAKVDTSNGGATKASVFYKILESGDFSGANIIGIATGFSGTGSGRIGSLVFHHPNGWDSATALVMAVSFNTNASPPQIVATMTDVARGVIGFSLFATSGTPTTLQYTWAGAPTGYTIARDPYTDDNTTVITVPPVTNGGHGLTRQDSTGVTINSGSTSHTDSHIVQADLGSALSGTGWAANQYVSAVNVGVGFTSSANATAGASTVTFTPPHYGTGTATVQADYQEFDVADTPGTVTASTGTNNNSYVVITVEFQAISSNRAFTLSENFGLTDTRGVVGTWVRNLANEAFGLTDNETATKNGNTFTQIVNDHLGITDVVPRALKATITDNLGATDSGTGSVSHPERLGLTDNAPYVQGWARTITDPFGIPSTTQSTVPGKANFSDRFGLTDQMIPFTGAHFAQTITDALGLRDSVGPAFGLVEHFGLTDHLIIVAPGAQHYFRPPTEDTVSDIAYDVPAIWNRLMKFYPLRKRGVAVWKLPDGTYTTNQPYPTIEDTFANRVSLFPATTTPPSGLGTSDSNLQTITYELVYLGGHVYPISQAEADALTAAGFGAGVSTTPP